MTEPGLPSLELTPEGHLSLNGQIPSGTGRSAGLATEPPEHNQVVTPKRRNSAIDNRPRILSPEAHRCAPPEPEELELLERESQKLESASPDEIIAWAVEHYFPKLTMATAFGPEGCLILSILAKIEPRVYVFNIDTGYQFPETLALRDRIAARYGIQIVLEQPEMTVEEYERLHGGPLYGVNPDQCCRDRKVAVARRVTQGFAAWLCGIRRDQSATRATVPIVGWDFKFGLVKINPLANWTSRQVWERIKKENIPYNPLHDCGYKSIGCWPCTRPVSEGEDERAGRWPGICKTECGLHVVDDKSPRTTGRAPSPTA